MTRRRSFLLIAAVALMALTGPGGGADSRAAAPAFLVIVHPDHPASAVDRTTLQRAFLKKERRWRGGAAIKPIDLPRGDATRDRFTREVLEKSPSQLKRYWNQQVFSGKGVPPPEADSAEAAIAYVLANPGAIGYLPAGADPQGAKVIAVE